MWCLYSLVLFKPFFMALHNELSLGSRTVAFPQTTVKHSQLQCLEKVVDKIKKKGEETKRKKEWMGNLNQEERGRGGKKEQASNAGIIAKHHHTPGQGKKGIVDEPWVWQRIPSTSCLLSQLCCSTATLQPGEIASCQHQVYRDKLTGAGERCCSHLCFPARLQWIPWEQHTQGMRTKTQPWKGQLQNIPGGNLLKIIPAKPPLSCVSIFH